MFVHAVESGWSEVIWSRVKMGVAGEVEVFVKLGYLLLQSTVDVPTDSLAFQ